MKSENRNYCRGFYKKSLKRNIEHFTRNFILNRVAVEKNMFTLLKVEIS